MSNRRGVGQDGTGRLATTVLAPDFVSVPRWKRALDISCVLIVIPLLLPLILITAIIIKAGSKGPLLFRQERIGLLGKRFVLLKFRTMNPGSGTAVHEAHVASLMESNGPMTKLDARGDARLIPFGRLLRAAGLDELPQLINVLRGEMSLVGPRPCLPGEYDRYLPWQRERFRTLPGLTGLWQVSGKNRTTFNEMIDFDIQYVRMQSAWLDLKIMLKTIPVVMDEVKNSSSLLGVGDMTGSASCRAAAHLAAHRYTMLAINRLGRFAHFRSGSITAESNGGGRRAWIGVDLDGTLAEYHGWVSIEHIGDPVPPMLERVKAWLGEGIEVRIFTARVSHPAGRRDASRAIGDWCEKHGLPRLRITSTKDFDMIELWDDRAVRVGINSGIRADEPHVGARRHGGWACSSCGRQLGPTEPAEQIAPAALGGRALQ